jgi:hypothetical protein
MSKGTVFLPSFSEIYLSEGTFDKNSSFHLYAWVLMSLAGV